MSDTTLQRQTHYGVFRCSNEPDALLSALPEIAESDSWPALRGETGCGKQFVSQVPRIYADLPKCPDCRESSSTVLLEVLSSR